MEKLLRGVNNSREFYAYYQQEQGKCSILIVFRQAYKSSMPMVASVVQLKDTYYTIVVCNALSSTNFNKPLISSNINVK